jgi:hypothetical protein
LLGFDFKDRKVLGWGVGKRESGNEFENLRRRKLKNDKIKGFDSGFQCSEVGIREPGLMGMGIINSLALTDLLPVVLRYPGFKLDPLFLIRLF